MKPMRIATLLCATAILLTLSACTAEGTSTPDEQAPQAAQWVMPNLIGSKLQQAQDAIQKLTGNPAFVTLSHDATGQSRNQVLDSNWKVCSQNVAAGATFDKNSKIDFGTVKLTEQCPA
jgi:ABC-type uncharacterized transport system auxiliary subunit